MVRNIKNLDVCFPGRCGREYVGAMRGNIGKATTPGKHTDFYQIITLEVNLEIY